MLKAKKIKILHTTMSLDIGGAETHIVELARYLNNDKYEIMVASNGGVYEEKLAEQGIKHFKIPLYTKNPLKVLASYISLRKLMIREKVDIVHAHARIPAFISGILCRQLGIVIVTTTHGRFKVNWLLRKLSDWGDKSIAVSEDLKAYLIDEYNYSEKDVYLSVNGIDTETFSRRNKRVRGSNIVHVSRLDAETSSACKLLIKNAETLYGLNPELRITVAGGGTEYEGLKHLADEANQKIGSHVIHMLGPVSNIPEVLEDADVFVGISRALLEAMNYEIPVMVAGDPGMMGILQPDMLRRCESHNFTCRGESPLNEKAFMDGLKDALDTEDEDLTWMSSYIREKYSVTRMALAYENLYADLLDEPKQYVIAGYYGYSNSGDDALLDSTCRDIYHNNPKNRITILSNQPIDKTVHYVAESIYRFNLLKVINAIRHSDILIMGGGTLLQDNTSSRSIWYYLAIIGLANTLKKKTYLYANGIGPIRKRFNRWLAKKVANAVDIITLRESSSSEELKALGVDRPYIRVTADPVFSLPFDEERDVNGLLERAGIDLSRPYCTAIFRSWKDDGKFIDKVAEVADYIKRTYDLQILFVPMKHPQDMVVEKQIIEQMEEESSLLVEKCDVQSLVEILGGAKICISMRLHGILYSAIRHVPSLGFSYDVKIDYYTKVLDQPLMPDVECIDPEKAKQAIDTIMSDYEKVVRDLHEKLRIQKDRARDNAILLKNLI